MRIEISFHRKAGDGFSFQDEGWKRQLLAQVWDLVGWDPGTLFDRRRRRPAKPSRKLRRTSRRRVAS